MRSHLPPLFLQNTNKLYQVLSERLGLDFKPNMMTRNHLHLTTQNSSLLIHGPRIKRITTPHALRHTHTHPTSHNPPPIRIPETSQQEFVLEEILHITLRCR